MHQQLLLVTKIMVTLKGIQRYPDILWHLHLSERKEQLPKANRSLLTPCGPINKEKDMACTAPKGQHYVWLLVGEFSQIPPTGHVVTAHSYIDARDFYAKCIFCHCYHGTIEETGSLGVSQSGAVWKQQRSHSQKQKGTYWTVRLINFRHLLLLHKEVIALWINSNP